MAEILVPTSPPSITSYRVEELLLSKQRSFIKVIVFDSANNRFVCTYYGTTARTLIRQLNTMDLSTNSLEKRLLERLATDGKLPTGTVTGTPDAP